MLADAVVVILSFFMALLLRFELQYRHIPERWLMTYHQIIIPWALVCVAVLALMGCYRSV